MDRYPAGLRMLVDEETLMRPERERTAVAEATAVLIEALAIEAAIYADAGVVLSLDVEVDWPLVGEHCGSSYHDARRRGCPVGHGGVAALLGHADWVSASGRKALREWSGISGLADAVGRGRVLEVDEVDRVLRR